MAVVIAARRVTEDESDDGSISTKHKDFSVGGSISNGSSNAEMTIVGVKVTSRVMAVVMAVLMVAGVALMAMMVAVAALMMVVLVISVLVLFLLLMLC